MHIYHTNTSCISQHVMYVSYHNMSQHVMTYHIISCHNMSQHIITYHVIPYHDTRDVERTPASKWSFIKEFYAVHWYLAYVK